MILVESIRGMNMFQTENETKEMCGVFLHSRQKKLILPHFPKNLLNLAFLQEHKRGGVVLDPFFGSGTTGRVAERLGRKWIGIELNKKYVEIAKKRTNDVQLQLLC